VTPSRTANCRVRCQIVRFMTFSLLC
jgi:hypothetical protein